jgi:hypothetical protein
MKALVLSTILFCISTCSIFAQHDFRDGYVVLANGDSITGKVAYRASFLNVYSCIYKSKSGEKRKYEVSEMLAYGYFFDKRFERKNLPVDSVTSEQLMAEVLIKGYVSLFKARDYLYVQKNGKLIRVPRTFTKKIQIEWQEYIVTDEQYITVLNTIVGDCALSANEMNYSQEKIAELLQNYNRCKDGSAGQTFKQSKPVTLVTFQGVIGLQSSTLMSVEGNQDLTTSVSPVYGVAVDFSAPRLFDRLLFSAEVHYSNQLFQYTVEEFTSTIRIYSDNRIENENLYVPFGVRYNFFRDFRTPYIKLGGIIGINLSSTFSYIREQETVREVQVYKESLNFKDSPQGIYGAIGYTHGISSHVKAFAEVRYCRFTPLAFDTFRTNSLMFTTGIRF